MTDRNRILHVFDEIAGTMRDLALASERIAARHPLHPDSVDLLQNATLYRSWSDTLRIGVRALAAMDDADAAELSRLRGELASTKTDRAAADEHVFALVDGINMIASEMEDIDHPLDAPLGEWAQALRALVSSGESAGAEQQGQHVEREREREEPDPARRNVERGEQGEDERNDQAQRSERHEGSSAVECVCITTPDVKP